MNWRAGLPAAAILACADTALRPHLVGLLGTRGYRLYGRADPIGAQVGGAAKNVIAIAAGIAIGAGLGENARAALVTAAWRRSPGWPWRSAAGRRRSAACPAWGT